MKALRVGKELYDLKLVKVLAQHLSSHEREIFDKSREISSGPKGMIEKIGVVRRE